MGGGSVEGVVDATAARIEVRAAEEGEVVADAQPLGHVEAQLHAEVVARVHVGVDVEHTLLGGVAARNEVVHVLRRAAGREGVAGRGLDVLVEDVPPVRVGVIVIDVAAGLVLGDDHPRAGGILDLVVAADPELLHVGFRIAVEVGSVVGAHEQVAQVDGVVTAGFPVGRGRRGGETGAAAVVDRRLAFLVHAVLGGHEDDAGRTFRTVDGGGGSILDDGDGLHVGGVDVLEVTFHAVDQHERAAAVDRVAAADVERGGLARTAGGGGDVQAGDGALQHMGHVQGGTVLEFVRLHDRHGAGQVGLFLRTVTDHDQLVKLLELFLERHVDDGIAAYLHLHGLIAQGGEDQRVAGIGRDGVAAVEIRRRADGGSFHEDAGAGDRIAGGIGHLAADDVVDGDGVLPGKDDHLAVERHRNVFTENGLQRRRDRGSLELPFHGRRLVHLVGTIEDGEPGLGLDFLEHRLQVLSRPLPRHGLGAGDKRREQKQQNDNSCFESQFHIRLVIKE